MHVHVHLERGATGRVELDGVDIASHVLADGFAILNEVDGPVVQLRLRPDVVDVDGTVEEVPGEVDAIRLHLARDDKQSEAL